MALSDEQLTFHENTTEHYTITEPENITMEMNIVNNLEMISVEPNTTTFILVNDTIIAVGNERSVEDYLSDRKWNGHQNLSNLKKYII